MLQSYENVACRDSESISASHCLTVTQKKEKGRMGGVREKGSRQARVQGSLEAKGFREAVAFTGERS